MAWFIGQSLLMILISFLLGLLVGWLIWSRRGKSTTDTPAAAEQPTTVPAPAETAAVAEPVAPAETAPKAKPARKAAKKAEAAPADDQIEVQQHPVSLVAPIAKPVEQASPEPEPVVAEPVVAEPVAAEPVVAEPVAAEPVAAAAEPDDSMEAIVEAAEAAQSAGFAAEKDGLTPEEVVLVAAGDNLQRIEGIGPRMEAALTAAGLGTYAALAEADNDRLRRAIEAQGLSFAPALLTWARQAKLLAEGDEEGLADLQRRLVAGRDTGRE
ncbi:helix-hairpin-helix domain-containing protein [Catellatospora sp. NPDC049609]|uniref:helix-hairpin-helix domain-containing protein n=1 Tax=Catellatospora sp. NPDC049609 TaxID=3155505 RepID=UPI0034378244